MTFCENGGTLLSVAAVTVTGPRAPAAAVPTGLPAQMHIVEFCDVEPLSPQHGSALSAGALPASVSTEPGSAGRRKRAAVAAHDMNLWIVEVSRCQMTGLGILIELEIDLENSGFGLSSQRSL